MGGNLSVWSGERDRRLDRRGLERAMKGTALTGKRRRARRFSLRALFLPGGLSGFTASPVRGAG